MSTFYAFFWFPLISSTFVDFCHLFSIFIAFAQFLTHCLYFYLLSSIFNACSIFLTRFLSFLRLSTIFIVLLQNQTTFQTLYRVYTSFFHHFLSTLIAFRRLVSLRFLSSSLNISSPLLNFYPLLPTLFNDSFKKTSHQFNIYAKNSIKFDQLTSETGEKCFTLNLFDVLSPSYCKFHMTFCDVSDIQFRHRDLTFQ